MDNKPQIFNHPIFGELPVIAVEGVEWFGATETAKALSFTNPHAAIQNHVEENDLTVREVIDSLMGATGKGDQVCSGTTISDSDS